MNHSDLKKKQSGRTVRWPVILSVVIIVLFGILGGLMVRMAPEAGYRKEIRIQKPVDQIVIGAKELGQGNGPGMAASRHLRIRHTDKSGWEIANGAKNRRVDIRSEKYPGRYLKRWIIRENDVIFIENARIEVLQADREGLVFRETESGRTAIWQDGRLTPKKESEKEYVYEKARDLYWFFRRAVRHRFKKYLNCPKNKPAYLFRIGGSLNCPDQWKIEGVPSGALRVYGFNDEYHMGPGFSDASVLFSRNGSDKFSFTDLWMPLKTGNDRIDRLIIGRTHYNVRIGTDALVLTPQVANTVWWDVESLSSQSTPGIEVTNGRQKWVGHGKSIWAWGLDWWVVIVGAFFLSLIIMQRAKSRFSYYRGSAGKGDASFTLFLIALGGYLLFLPLLFFLWKDRGVIDLSIILFLTWAAWAAATMIQTMIGRLAGKTGILWCIALILCGTGCLTLVQLAAGADNTHWLRYARIHLFLMIFSGCGIGFSAVLSRKTLTALWFGFAASRAPGWILVRWCSALGVMAALIVQPFFGSEKGLGPIQPAEAGKFLLAIMAGFTGAHLIELRWRYSGLYQKNRIPFLIHLLKFLALTIVALVWVLASVNDNSPVLILLVLCMAWFWTLAPHPWKETRSGIGGRAKSNNPLIPDVQQLPRSGILIRGLILVSVAILILSAFRFYTHPEEVPEWIPQRDRLLVWSEPDRYPHSGKQVLDAMELAGRGGFLGAGETFLPFGKNGDVIDLPAVRNDFIGTFLLFRFGGIAALLLICVQMGYVLVLLAAASDSREKAKAAESETPRNAAYVRSLSLYGLAWMHLAHWAIAWGNAMGILPVMGQPMTWISAATSHMLFFGLPTLGLGLVSFWTVEG